MITNIRLKRNQTIRLTNGKTATVVGKLGEGGQGIVYRVQMDDSGEEKALKWYFATKLKDANKFYKHLDQNIRKGAPSHYFVWPQALTEKIENTFGYIMDIYPKEYQGFPRFLNGKVSFASAAAMVNSGLQIVTAFKELHNQGWNYQDLNDGNFSIEPRMGKVLICDNDNVMGHGEHSGVLGKARYMAPETVRGEREPDKHTDRFSLAVVLFMLFMNSHPLEGKKTNVAALTSKYERRFFGESPLFIYDSKDASNRPIPGLHNGAIARWKYFPSFFREAFCKSFSQESLLKTEGRLLEQQWIGILIRLKSSLVKCPHCGDEIFLESNQAMNCPNCGKELKAVGYIKLPKRASVEMTVPIIGGAHLYRYQIDESAENFDAEIATVLEKPGKFGLKNDAGESWTITAPNGKSAVKQPGDTAVIGIGFRIDFGHGSVGEIIQNK